MHVRQREVRRKKKKKKAQKKPLRHDRDLNPRTLSPEPSALSTRPQCPALRFPKLLLIQSFGFPISSFFDEKPDFKIYLHEAPGKVC